MLPRREFGSNGVQVPVIGQGTWQMQGDDRKSAIEALRAGIDLGMTHIDTAELYGSGRVEQLVAEAIAGRRNELYLVSKVMPSHASRAGTIRACEQSLKRLRTDRLVELCTRYYVVSPRVSMQPAAVAAGGTYAVTRAIWEPLYSRYHVPRAALERALGEPLSVDPERSRQFSDLTLSFDADLVPFYVASEIAFPTLWFSLFGLVVVRVPRLSLVLPLLCPWAYLPFGFVLLYSPAFFDADWFFQRVVVERIALLSLFGGVALALPAALALLVGKMQLLAWLMERSTIRKMLRHLGLPPDPPVCASARASPDAWEFDTTA